MNRAPTGRVAPDAIRRSRLERLPARLLERAAGLEDLTATLSDALDQLGLAGAVPASVLAPNLPERRLLGQAVTVRNVERIESATRSAASARGLMGEQEAYNLAEPGDVVVIEGLLGVSNMGGQSASLAHRAGCAGVVIDGSYRDPQTARALGFPVWARGLTPLTGKWRLHTVEINGRVRVGGVGVDAGDLVAADEAGVVFVPFAYAAAVLDEALRLDQGDRRQKADIRAGVDLATLAATRYK